jgi:hypothetical protein
MESDSLYIYVSSASYEQMRNEWTIVEKEYEKKGGPGLHKWKASAFIDRSVNVIFEEGQPIALYSSLSPDISYQCSFSRSSSFDKSWCIPKTNLFKAYLAQRPTFTLRLDVVDDGCCRITIAKAYTNDQMTYDFTVFE